MLKKKNIFRTIILLLVLLFFILFCYTSYLFIKSVFFFNGIEDMLRYSLIGLTGILIIVIVINFFNTFKKNKLRSYILYLILIIVFLAIQYFVYYNLNKFISTAEGITNKYSTYSTNLIVLKESNVKSISELKKEKIGMINDKNSIDGYIIGMEIIEKNNIDKSNLVYYDDYNSLIDALYAKEIAAAFINNSYKTLSISNDDYETIESDIKVILNMKKIVKNDNSNKTMNKPFSALIIGVDSEKENLKNSTSFNGDSLILMTFNPNTSNATILSIPRDTYVPIACLKNKYGKINSSSWYGTDCMIKTIENLTDIKIDYWVKINFKGVVEMVDTLGGIEVDVPYTFCEQDSNRTWGKNTIFLKKGLQTLNGEQALALSRHRKISEDHHKYCTDEYLKYTYINDFVRGQSQQLVVNGILNSIKKTNSLKKIYSLLNVIENNIETNVNKDDILSSYNMLKKVVSISTDIKSMDFVGTQRLYLSGYDSYMYYENMNRYLYQYVYYKGSLNDVSNAMKENLEIKKPKIYKEFYFSIKNHYTQPYIGKGVYSN